jgi:hypothetical protein
VLICYGYRLDRKAYLGDGAEGQSFSLARVAGVQRPPALMALIEETGTVERILLLQGIFWCVPIQI